jgi:ribonuclease P protein component
MLPKINRGLGKGEIDVVFANNTSTKNDYFTVLKKEIEGEVNPRFAIIISKKVAKRAVDRNRIKRLIFDQIQKELTTYKPGHYVVLVKNTKFLNDNLSLRGAKRRSNLKTRIATLRSQ